MTLDQETKKAFNDCLRRISRRPRSVKETADYLKEKGYNDKLVSDVLDRLKRLGYLNDKKFAEYWTEGRTKIKPLGVVALKKELERKGLDRELIEKAAGSRQSENSDYELARKEALKRLKVMGRIAGPKAKKRIYDYLVRHGYEFDIIYNVLDEIF
jgi:regulatory protein